MFGPGNGVPDIERNLKFDLDGILVLFFVSGTPMDMGDKL